MNKGLLGGGQNYHSFVDKVHMKSSTYFMRASQFCTKSLLIAALCIGHIGRVEAQPSAQPFIVADRNGNAEAAFWLSSSLQRIFPTTAPGSTNLHLLAARNAKISFQACLHNRQSGALYVDCKITGADDLKPRVRLVGFAPVWHHTCNTANEERDGVGKIPGLVPDPLWPMQRANAGPNESRSFWVTLNIPADAKPGVREFNVQLTVFKGKPVTLPVQIEISDFVVQPRTDFHVIHWWRGEATWDYYKLGMFDAKWWQYTRWQLEDMLDHGSDVVYVPVFFDRREAFKHPCQLLIVDEPEPGKYKFDWSRVKRFTDMCKKIGFKKFEWSHIWIYWGVKNPVRIYKKQGDNYVMLWPPDTGATSETYVNFLKQFLPQFHDFLAQENILDDSYFHLSDEPGAGEHVENYKRARKLLRDLAPWMKVMDALSDIEYGRQGLTDMPIPLVAAAQPYIDEKIPHWVYYCCGPQGPWLNRFIDTPLAKVRMSGWLFYRLHAKGFLHWGFNYWDKFQKEEAGDPFNDASDSAWPAIPYGDPFMIYPGRDGRPMDCIRWEVFSESLQDYAILQTAGIKPDDAMLSDIKTYGVFPKNEEWIQKTLQKILKGSSKNKRSNRP
jgi:hypothetical protein